MSTPYGSPVAWEPNVTAAALPPLDREVIVQAAVRLADAGGLDGVSIRKVASELGVGPMRLYSHVRTKDDLHDLMVDVAYGEVAASVRQVEGWREELHDIARSFRATAFRHEWFVDLLGGRPHLGPQALAVLEATAAAVEAAPGERHAGETWSALGAINAYLIGAVRADVVEGRAVRASGRDEREWQADVAPYLRRMFETGRYPTLQRLTVEAEQPDPEEDFARGLDLVLDGCFPGGR